jgi:hypothetical protein
MSIRRLPCSKDRILEFVVCGAPKRERIEPSS